MKYAFLLTVAALSGCAAPITQVAQSASVRPATSAQVERCEYLDDLTGTSGWYGMFATQGTENARQELLAKAAKVGATHIVWAPPILIYGSTSVAAKAYRCSN
jgi:hypothetical protein